MPLKAVRPNIPFNIIVSIVAGLILGIGMAFLIERIGQREIVNAQNLLVNSGFNASIEDISRHIFSGGDVKLVVEILIKAKETGLALLDDNSLIDLKQNEIPPNRKLLEPITNEMLRSFDNYKKNEIEKFVYRSKNKTNHEIDLNNNIKLIQIIGNNFSNKTYKPLVLHNTGFNLSILKAKKGFIENLTFNKPTVLFSQKGNWKIKIEDKEFNIYSKDTFSIPLDKKITISVDNNEDCFLNCVSQA